METKPEEVHKNATFTWRKTMWTSGEMYVLLGWKNVLSKNELPHEYTEYGPHFWEAGDKIYISYNSTATGNRHLIERFKQSSSSYIPPELYQGQLFTKTGFVALIHHLRRSCGQLRDLRLKISESEEIVTELIPLPDPKPQEPPVAPEETVEEEVSGPKPSFLERVEHVLHGWNKQTVRERKI